jgi:aldose 1-epimerase
LSRFKIKENNFGDYDTLLLYDEKTDHAAEIALQGATLLNFTIPLNEVPFNIIDGFASPEEFKAARGARCWIMAPFANRIPKGKYSVEGKDYQLKPIPPRENIIHGFAAYQLFELKNKVETNEFVEVILHNDSIRPGKYEGYPFSIDITVTIKLEEGKISLSVIGENVGENSAPFQCGWHPYFKTGSKGIDHLVLTLDADKIVKLDENYIPLKDEAAYADAAENPELNFSSLLPKDERIIGKRILNDCFTDLKINSNSFSSASIYDPSNNLEIEIFQQGGVTLVYSGDQLASRKRHSIAIEPMQYITNAFNRKELEEKVLINPGEKSIFNFGVKAGKRL